VNLAHAAKEAVVAIHDGEVGSVGRWGSNPRPRDYEVGAIGRTGPVVSDWFGNLCVLRPVVPDWPGGVGLICGMKREILLSNFGP